MKTLPVRHGDVYKFDPLGRCMYCGAPKADLRLEHIIPFSMKGVVEFPKASCEDCADITSDFELKLTRGEYYSAREVGKFPSYNRKKKKRSRPKLQPLILTFIRNGREVEEKRDIPAENRPAFLHLLELDAPGILTGREAQDAFRYTSNTVKTLGVDPQKFMKDLGAIGLTSKTRAEPILFHRLLAKIAYGTAVAMLGYDRVNDSPLRDIIRGQMDYATTLIGSTDEPIDSSMIFGEHALDVREEGGPNGAIIVNIALFVEDKKKSYTVVVKHPNWPSYLAKPVKRIARSHFDNDGTAEPTNGSTA